MRDEHFIHKINNTMSVVIFFTRIIYYLKKWLLQNYHLEPGGLSSSSVPMISFSISFRSMFCS